MGAGKFISVAEYKLQL